MSFLLCFVSTDMPDEEDEYGRTLVISIGCDGHWIVIIGADVPNKKFYFAAPSYTLMRIVKYIPKCYTYNK